jgi:hypothetical protein
MLLFQDASRSGSQLATVIVVHDPGRLFPEAIIFTTTAAKDGEK